METTIATEQDRNATVLASQAQPTRIHGPADEPVPELPEVRPPQLLLPRNLAAVAKICAKDSTRYGATTAVRVERLEPEGEGWNPRYRAVATDGRRLIQVDGTSDKPEDFPPVPGIASAPNGADTAHIDAREWQKAFKSAPTRYKPILQNVALVMSEQCSTLATTNLDSTSVTQPRNVEGRFPDYAKAFPSKRPVVKFSVDPKLFSETLNACEAFTDDNSKRVIITVYDPSSPIMLETVRSPEGQKCTALVVPLVANDSPTKKAEDTAKEVPYAFWRELGKLATEGRKHFLKHATDTLKGDMADLRALLSAHGITE